MVWKLVKFNLQTRYCNCGGFDRNFLKLFNDMYYQMIPFSVRKFEAFASLF